MNKLFRIICLITVSASLNAQIPLEHARIELSNELNLFIDEVSIINTHSGKKLLLDDDQYTIASNPQFAQFEINNGKINGSLKELGKQNNYTLFDINNSIITKAREYEGDKLVMEGYVEENMLRYKQYYKSGKLMSDGWISLNKRKYFGRGIVKEFSENGQLNKEINTVKESYKFYHDNGQLKEKIEPNGSEHYDVNGTVIKKSYTKDNIHYTDYYQDGLISESVYFDENDNEVKIFYIKGKMVKKQLVKEVNGNKRLLTYDQSGKLINDENYQDTLPSMIETDQK